MSRVMRNCRGGADLGQGGDMKLCWRQRVQKPAALLYHRSGAFAGFAGRRTLATVSSQCLAAGLRALSSGSLETGEKVVLGVPHAVFPPALFIALADIARHMAKPVCVAQSRDLASEHRAGLTEGALKARRI